jgi:MFS family permease
MVDATGEARLKLAVIALAFLSSALSFLVLGGVGATMLVVPSSGEQGTGALLGFCGAIAFVSVMVLVFASEARFREATWRAGAIAAAIIGAMPVAGLAAAAFRFAGLPFRSAMPSVDWSIFLGGVFFVLGALAILALGYRRARTEAEDEAEGEGEPAIVHMQQIRNAQMQLRTALERADLAAPEIGNDEVRVRRV